MINKQKSTTSERAWTAVIKKIGQGLERKSKAESIRSLKKLGEFSPQLIEELGEFIKRNSILEVERNNAKCQGNGCGNYYCEKCLKAHALTLVKEMDLGKGAEEQVHQAFNAEAGHHGYYMDGEQLVRCETK